MSSRNFQSHHRWLLVGVVVVASFALFGVAEVGIRIRHYMKYGIFQRIEDTYKNDPKTGLRITVPGLTTGGIRINSLGFRGPEIPIPKPTDTIRVAFLGSSTTFCADVPRNEDTWPDLVTTMVHARWPEVNVDYINAGVPGYSVANSLQNLKLRVAPLAPDIIVIYEGHNDLSGNTFQLARKQGLASKQTEQNISWLAHYSLLWYLVEKNVMLDWRLRSAQNAEGKIRFDKEAATAPFEHDLRDLVTAGRKVASLVVLVTFSTQLRRDQSAEQQARAAVTSFYYMPYMTLGNLIEGYASYNEVVRRVALDTGSLMIDGENTIPGDSLHFVDSVHFSARGSRVMAERVATGLTGSEALQEMFSRKSASLATKGETR